MRLDLSLECQSYSILLLRSTRTRQRRRAVIIGLEPHGAMVELAGADSLLGAVDFLRLPQLAAYAACAQLCKRQVNASWPKRVARLELEIPSHVKWRPRLDQQLTLKPIETACATYRLAKGIQLYEQRRFRDAEQELRALLRIAWRPFAMCRLADTLYGRAVSLKVSSPESSSAEDAEAVQEPRAEPEEDHEEEGAVPYSRSPVTPTPPRVDGDTELRPQNEQTWSPPGHVEAVKGLGSKSRIKGE